MPGGSRGPPRSRLGQTPGSASVGREAGRGQHPGQIPGSAAVGREAGRGQHPGQTPGSAAVGREAGRGQHPRALRRRRRHFAAAPPPPSCDRRAEPDLGDGSLGWIPGWIPGTASGKGNRGERGPPSLRGHKRSPFRKERGQPSPVAAVSPSQPGFEGAGLSHCVLQAGLEIQVEPRLSQAAQALSMGGQGPKNQGTVSHYTPCCVGSSTVPRLVHHSPHGWWCHTHDLQRGHGHNLGSTPIIHGAVTHMTCGGATAISHGGATLLLGMALQQLWGQMVSMGRARQDTIPPSLHKGMGSGGIQTSAVTT
ncbi:glutenin, high molecular weight subunit DX5-like isoform X2 [Motacilla alba alba]|uniref:glutenin, high molecular weight subunit DX5-like isoform X1 n=1 Tax=Motacilla alba alba TaxID=1094192 RepID=UPI0018D52BB5|nr:glutenin, high molecular weight subunit DX5-like isoform X1 [Motacilla alba alba]XP_038003373.1 glutenin, high molecular weight subunit DX5-like isoform X2 [Motacilla alba alba]